MADNDQNKQDPAAGAGAGGAAAGGDNGAGAGAGAGGAAAGGEGAAAGGGQGNDGAGAGNGAAAAGGEWHEDWRNRMSGQNEKLQNLAGRYASPTALAEAFLELKTQLDSGKLRRPLGENPTPEDVAEYRKQNGIPEKAEDYNFIPEGYTVSETDKTIFKSFLEKMHGLNATTSQVQAGVAAYYDAMKEAQETLSRTDSEAQRTAEAALKAEWGAGEFDQNMNVIANLTATMPGDLGDQFLNLRLPNGTRVGDSPDMLRWLVDRGLDANPLSRVMPNHGAEATQQLASEMQEIRKAIANPQSDYYKGPRDPNTGETKMATRFRELLEVEEKLQARGG